ncbi:hypothetical protein F3Y22_tig00116012pilonHSYRG00001 [Hibiscus syriacus]|uniref:Cytochrome P450 78A7-like n=1 Tax=Hibiscus syriacus TaxID=106335 RepID=A0A6A2WMU0_HIBSY|nr:hypothetical protein F3Y22_tig00116012pilonHSYRG00001 [Hibiscus syriacus]
MRPSPDCRPAVGAPAPKGTCRGCSARVGQVARASLERNFHRAAGRILCRRLKYATGYCKWQSGLAARSTEIQPFVASIRPPSFISPILLGGNQGHRAGSTPTGPGDSHTSGSNRAIWWGIVDHHQAHVCVPRSPSAKTDGCLGHHRQPRAIGAGVPHRTERWCGSLVTIRPPCACASVTIVPSFGAGASVTTGPRVREPRTPSAILGGWPRSPSANPDGCLGHIGNPGHWCGSAAQNRALVRESRSPSGPLCVSLGHHRQSQAGGLGHHRQTQTGVSVTIGNPGPLVREPRSPSGPLCVSLGHHRQSQAGGLGHHRQTRRVSRSPSATPGHWCGSAAQNRALVREPRSPSATPDWCLGNPRPLVREYRTEPSAGCGSLAQRRAGRSAPGPDRVPWGCDRNMTRRYHGPIPATGAPPPPARFPVVLRRRSGDAPARHYRSSDKARTMENAPPRGSGLAPPPTPGGCGPRHPTGARQRLALAQVGIMENSRESLPTVGSNQSPPSIEEARESTSIEPMVAEFGEKLERVQHDFKTLEDHVLEQVDTLKGNAEETNNEVEARFIQLEDMIQAVRESIEGMREDLTLCKRAAVSGSANHVSTRGSSAQATRVQRGKDAKEVENYLWRMEQYFEGIGLNDEAAKVKTAALYLSDTAMLWWRRKHADIERGACRVDTWDEFKKELKKHFYPENVVYEARKKLRELKQRARDAPSGLKTVDEAIAIAESLVDFQPYSHTNATKNKDKYPAKGGGERRENYQGNRDRDHRRPQTKEGDRDRRPGRRDYEEKKKAFVPKGGCFLCKGPHPMSSCPKLGSLSAIVDRQDTESQAEMAVINEKSTRAMVDTGATHNFVSKDEANRLGLKYTGSTGWLKTVNTQAVPLHGVARGVELRLGTWKGQVNFSVIPMDDFKVVLGLDFLRQVTAIPMPSFSSVCILEKGSPCMIPTVEAPKEKGRDATQLSAIQLVLEENKDVMPPELPNKLPPRREVDHKIELEPGAKPPALAPYRMAPPELEELRRQLKELVDMGMIRPSKAPYGARYSSKRSTMGHCAYLEEPSVHKDGLAKRLLPSSNSRRRRAKDRMHHPIRIVRVVGHALWSNQCTATFCTLMNKLFQPYLDQFMVVYLDDIVVYSNSIREHVDHLRIVFKILRENELYVKKEKCTFATEEVHFLGHVIGHGKLLMDRNKIKAITEWEPPTKVSEMRSFLGLVNYYRRFIQGYSARASPLTDLLKKGKAWEWSEQCQKAFENLKAAVSQEPVLALPDFTMPFEVHTDASDFAIGGVLMQEGHPIAFESRKLNDTERRYTVQEKEMTAIIHCLRVWRHYLLGAHFTIKTDNVATSYFQTQKKLSPKQARWQDFLAEFDYTLEYKPGKANVVADALSRKAELAAISLAKGTVLERIKEGLEQDPMARELVKLASDGKTQRFWVEDALLYTKGRRIYVPKWDNLRRDLVKECHDTKWAGHPGQKRTMALLETAYFWPHMKDSVELYVKTCLVCQQDKVENRQPTGLLEPLPVPQRPWDAITLDFISALPKSEGYGSIMVVVDRFSKYGTFIPCPKDCTAEEAARAFFKNVVKHWGLPRSIISDRDPRFTGRLWTELFKLLGTELNFSTSFHPQTDGQTERVNSLLECYLRHFVSANQRDWAKLLDVAQFSYNLQRSEATGRSPFELATGQQPLTPHTLSMPLDEGKSPGAAKMAKSWEENADIARACLEKARKKMKKWADEKRRHREFSVGDLVFVKLLPQQFKALRSVHKGLIRRYEGPFQVLAKPYHADKEDPSRGYSHRAPPVVTKSYDKEVETVLTRRTVRKRGVPPRTEYLIKWKGLPESEATWELAEDLWQFEEHLKAYEATRTTPE